MPPAATVLEAIPCEARPVAAKPLHVAVALGGADLGRSGIGTYVRELLPPLIEQVGAQRGRVTVFGHATELAAFASAAAHAARVTVRGVPAKAGLNALWYLARAGAFARRLGADVLLLPAGNRRITYATGLPTVAVVHDLAQLRVDRKYDALRMAYFRRVLIPAFHRPDRLIAISSATRDDLVSRLGVPGDRVSIVYNGVNRAQFCQEESTSEAVEDARRRLGLHDRPYLLYPARLEHPGKNHVRLLRAFAASGLAASHTLALSGADWGARTLIQDAIGELGLGSSVKLLGFVSGEDLPRLVAGAAAVLMLGLHEGFGLPALEGLSAGRPVCVSNTGALPEVVGPLGAACDPLDETSIRDALRRVILDAELRERCQQEGPAWAGRFTWERTARGILEACHDVAG